MRMSDLESEGFSLEDCIYSEKPLVLTHPVTDEQYLWLTEWHTSHIPELDDDEGEQVLQTLIAHMNESPVYQHDWKELDIVIWDNMLVQHARPKPVPATRTLRRVASYQSADGQEGASSMSRLIQTGSKNA
jgi:taurine dioxygenase